MSEALDPMRVFVAAVDTGSFTAAADRLEITPSAVSKIVSRLEDRLGVRLLNRTTRRLELTSEGETYHTGAVFILAETAELETAVGQAGRQAKGLLRINTGTAFGNYQLVPHLHHFLAAHPDIEVAIDLTDRRVDVIAERADVAIRTGPVGDGPLIARRFAEMQRVICAAPSYLARHGAPATPAELAHHECLLLSDQPSLNRWPFRTAGADTPQLVPVRGRVTAVSAEAVLQLALSGVGIVRLGDVLVGESIRQGRLLPLLADHHLVEAVPISAVYPAGRHRSAKVRVFVEFLAAHFGSAPWSAWRTPPRPPLSPPAG
jgi:DNA-binding transcriptional LysR family regulator